MEPSPADFEIMKSMSYKDFDKFVPVPHGFEVMVIKVYDGDSFTIGFRDFSGEFTRSPMGIYGIDTPELRSKTHKSLAKEAKELLSSIILHKIVTILHPTVGKRGNVICDLSTESIPSVMDYMLEQYTLCRQYISGKKPPWVTLDKPEETNHIISDFRTMRDNYVDVFDFKAIEKKIRKKEVIKKMRKKVHLKRTDLKLEVKLADRLNASTSGEHIDMGMKNGKTKIVRRGESTNMKRANSITIPFGESDGKGQKASLILSNNSKVDISYDEVTSEIVLGGKTYAHGESFELDGKKAKFLII